MRSNIRLEPLRESVAGPGEPDAQRFYHGPVSSTVRFRYLAEGGRWFDDDTISLGEGQDAIIAV
jgi:hypothetical protein